MRKDRMLSAFFCMFGLTNPPGGFILTLEQMFICFQEEDGMARSKYAEVCEEVCTHPEILGRVAPEMPDEERLYDLAELFKVFGDTTRIRILYVLFESEMCVCDIAALLNMTQSAISHQLRILKQARLVRSRREGKTIFYALDDDHVRTVIGQGMEHIEEGRQGDPRRPGRGGELYDPEDEGDLRRRCRRAGRHGPGAGELQEGRAGLRDIPLRFLLPLFLFSEEEKAAEKEKLKKRS